MRYLLYNKITNSIILFFAKYFILDKKEKHKIKEYIRDYPEKIDLKKLEKKYRNYYIFALFSPWGDFGIACSLMQAFKNKNGGKIVVFVQDKQRFNVAKLFSAIDEVVIVNKKIFSYINRHPNTSITRGRVFEINHWVFVDAPKYKSSNFLELYKHMLNLNISDCLQKPVMTEMVKKNVKQFLQKNDLLDKNIILIAPFANSFNYKKLNTRFWISLAKRLTEYGYYPVFNSKKKIFANYKTVFLPMAESLYLSSLCERVIAIRAGFNDLLGIMGLDNLTIIYPNVMFFNTISRFLQRLEFKRAFLYEEDKTFNMNMYRITTAKMFNAASREIIFDGNKENLKEKIIESIK